MQRLKTLSVAFVGISTALCVSACETTSDAPATEAMLTESSPETTQILTKAVSKALGGVKVTLAPSVLTDSSKLIIDPKFVDDRSFQRPDHFTLMKAGNKCYLEHKQSGQKMPLANVDCTAL